MCSFLKSKRKLKPQTLCFCLNLTGNNGTSTHGPKLPLSPLGGRAGGGRGGAGMFKGTAGGELTK